MARTAILTGDTFAHREVLKRYWKWDADRKVWTREADADDTAEYIERVYVRALPGIRNRGKFNVALEG